MKKSSFFRQPWLWLGLSVVITGVLIWFYCRQQTEEAERQELLLSMPKPVWQDSVLWKNIDTSGEYTVREFDTSNKSSGKNEVDGVILHHTACKTIKEAFDTLTVGKSGVSCHVLIDADGTRYLLAPPETVTHHAGLSRLNGRDGANNFTLGIEFQGNTLDAPLTDAQIASAIEYLRPILKEYDVPLKNIVTHEQIRANWKKAHPKRKDVPDKVDVTPGEYEHFMSALRDSLNYR
jgi:N-acetyl-anhydromuramyl-L-alanine amidase AmpD